VKVRVLAVVAVLAGALVLAQVVVRELAQALESAEVEE
jgi:hypothetical protein